MFMIPGSKSSVKESLEQTIGSTSQIEIDENCHMALKDGGLSTLAPSDALASIPLNSSGLSSAGMDALATTGATSMVPLAAPTGMVPLIDEMNESLGGEIDKEDLQEMTIQVKRGENCLKLGVHLLPTLKGSEQDLGIWDPRSGAGR